MTSIAVVVLVVLLGVAIAVMMPRLMRMQRTAGNLSRVTRKHLTGPRVIRPYNTQRFHEGRFEETNAELTRNDTQMMAALALLMLALTMLMTALMLTIYTLSAGMIDSVSGAERITLLTQTVVSSTYVSQIVDAFMMLAFVFVFFPRVGVSWKEVLEVLDTEPLIRGGGASVGHLGFRRTVEFESVSLHYPDAEDDVPKEIFFIMESGQTMAVTGSTESGKSSIVNLIPRFYDAREGQVLLNGRDVCEQAQEALRNRISLVSQKATLSSGMIASNISYGKGAKRLAPADIVEAARMANASEFIATKEDDYASAVAQGGSNFPGGQKQRLLITWVVTRDGKVMISDDSFSTLDYKTNCDVRVTLRDTAAGATIIIVAQRIDIARNTDKILVVDKRRVVGIGTRDELFASNPVYREITLSQLNEGELA